MFQITLPLSIVALKITRSMEAARIDAPTAIGHIRRRHVDPNAIRRQSTASPFWRIAISALIIERKMWTVGNRSSRARMRPSTARPAMKTPTTSINEWRAVSMDDGRRNRSDAHRRVATREVWENRSLLADLKATSQMCHGTLACTWNRKRPAILSTFAAAQLSVHD